MIQQDGPKLVESTPDAAAITLASASSAFAADDLIVKIGHAAPLTGSMAFAGKENENTANMAIEELNARVTKIGGKRAHFVLVNEDDAGDPKQGALVAQKLVDAKVNGVVGHATSGASIVAAKIYHDAGIPQISSSATSPAYTAMPGYKSTFRVVANDDQLGNVLGRYAVQRVSPKTIAVIDDRTAYGQGIADACIKGAKNQDSSIRFLQRQYTNDKAVDFNAILTAIKASKPDVIFFGGMYSVAAPMVRQLKALGVQSIFMGGDGICTQLLADLAGDSVAAMQIFCAKPGGIADAQKRGAAEFSAAYKKKFGMEIKVYGMNNYDAVMTLADAMQQAKSSDPAVYLPFLQNIHHKGIIGEIAFTPNGDMVDGTLTMFTFNTGKLQQIGVVK